MVSVDYSDRAIHDLSQLDKHIAKRIVRKVEKYSEAEDPLSFAKSLSGTYAGRYRFRVGDYRVIFVVNGDGKCCILTILTVAYRKGAYKG